MAQVLSTGRLLLLPVRVSIHRVWVTSLELEWSASSPWRKVWKILRPLPHSGIERRNEYPETVRPVILYNLLGTSLRLPSQLHKIRVSR